MFLSHRYRQSLFEAFESSIGRAAAQTTGCRIYETPADIRQPPSIMSQEAVDLKNKGNKAFAAGDFITAVDLYSKAIERNDKEPTFFTNRAQVSEPIPSVQWPRHAGRVTNLVPSLLLRHTSKPKPMDMPLPMPERRLTSTQSWSRWVNPIARRGDRV